MIPLIRVRSTLLPCVQLIVLLPRFGTVLPIYELVILADNL
ncbi:hypothetical protein P4555_00720 [Peribacillus frigoritolerans]|nr:hypothetical protein [Peribacillus frigoritolerans]